MALNAFSATEFKGMCRTDPFFVCRSVTRRPCRSMSFHFRPYCSLEAAWQCYLFLALGSVQGS